MRTFPALTFALCCSVQAQPSRSGPDAAAAQLLASGRIEEALAGYRELAAKYPGHAEYEDQIGFILAATKRTEEAIPHFERAVQAEPKYARGYYHLGVALHLTQR